MTAKPLPQLPSKALFVLLCVSASTPACLGVGDVHVTPLAEAGAENGGTAGTAAGRGGAGAASTNGGAAGSDEGGSGGADD
jgi:hypothetical protein